MTETNNRQAALTHWVAQQLGAIPANIKLTPITNDAGFRQYFRFATPSQWLAVDAPPVTEDSRQFIALARHLSAQGVSTPRILAADEQQGFLLVEDFGDELIYRVLNQQNATHIYQQAFATLIKLQASQDNPALIPRYDRALLRRELQIFSEWFVQQLLGYQVTDSEAAMLDDYFTLLENTALEQPQTLVHRDFHSRNLLIRKGEQALGVIDFQGALWGGCTYDLVSLVRDCYLRWPADQVRAWAHSYQQQATVAGVIPSVSEAQFMRWFDLLGLQRHIKVLGIFARLHLRDGKAHYLQDLPLVMRYTLEVANQYPELAAFCQWFEQKLLPLAARADWYSDYRQAGDTA